MCKSATKYLNGNSGISDQHVMTASCCSPTDVGFAAGCEGATKYLNSLLNSTTYSCGCCRPAKVGINVVCDSVTKHLSGQFNIIAAVP